VHSAAIERLRAVVLDVMLGSFFGVLGRVRVMSLSQVRVMRRLFMIAGLMMFGGFAVVVGSMVVMLGGLRMMMRGFLRHDWLLFGLQRPALQAESARLSESYFAA
jgi:hypothetical protein